MRNKPNYKRRVTLTGQLKAKEDGLSPKLKDRVDVFTKIVGVGIFLLACLQYFRDTNQEQENARLSRLNEQAIITSQKHQFYSDSLSTLQYNLQKMSSDSAFRNELRRLEISQRDFQKDLSFRQFALDTSIRTNYKLIEYRHRLEDGRERVNRYWTMMRKGINRVKELGGMTDKGSDEHLKRLDLFYSNEVSDLASYGSEEAEAIYNCYYSLMAEHYINKIALDLEMASDRLSAVMNAQGDSVKQDLYLKYHKDLNRRLSIKPCYELANNLYSDIDQNEFKDFQRTNTMSFDDIEMFEDSLYQAGRLNGFLLQERDMLLNDFNDLMDARKRILEIERDSELIMLRYTDELEDSFKSVLSY